MAAGDYILDEDGNIKLDANGNYMVSDGAGDDCECGCGEPVVCIRCGTDPACCTSTAAVATITTKPPLAGGASDTETGRVKNHAATQFNAWDGVLDIVIHNGTDQITFNAYQEFTSDGNLYRLKTTFNPCTKELISSLEIWNGSAWVSSGLVSQFFSVPASTGAAPTYDCCTLTATRYTDNTGDSAVDEIAAVVLELTNNKCCESPDWSNSTTYALGDMVAFVGSIYRSIQNSNLNHFPSDTAWWEHVQEGLCMQTATDNCPGYDDCTEEDI